MNTCTTIELDPLIKVFRRSYPINTKEEMLKYIENIGEALRKCTKLDEAVMIRCYKCKYYGMCYVEKEMQKYHNSDILRSTTDFALICKRFKEDKG